MHLSPLFSAALVIAGTLGPLSVTRPADDVAAIIKRQSQEFSDASATGDSAVFARLTRVQPPRSVTRCAESLSRGARAMPPRRIAALADEQRLSRRLLDPVGNAVAVPRRTELRDLHYQIFTRSAGARYILSPGFTLNVVSNTSLFTSGTSAR